ncbi:MAG: hypothetical protein O7I42_15540, partial [Alphaproteobacteria bacterium]|nr:hypothetical protein [Alphaproteobacteria bacterium]
RDDRYHDRADKNEFSHAHDALQYVMLGAGEGRALLGREKRKRSGPPPQRASMFCYGPGARRAAR